MTFPREQRYCVFDYETYSEVDLKKVGSYEYSVHPSTEILCVAWATGTREQFQKGDYEVSSWVPDAAKKGLEATSVQPLLAAMKDPSVILVAHNSLFENLITKHVLARKVHTQEYLRNLGPERFLCTAALASALALPRSLEGAAAALKLPVQKDLEGRRLMLKWCKPRKASKLDPSTRHSDPEELVRLVAYCVQDVLAEIAVFVKLPHLTRTERAVWELDQRINLRGFEVDRQLVTKALEMIEVETEEIDRQTAELTDGLVSSTRQVGELQGWLSGVMGVELSDLRAGTVEAALEADELELPYYAREVLKLRQRASKTSTAKFLAFELRTRSDGRCRDNLIYHRASTGRWGGAGVQPQNLPRPWLEWREIEYCIGALAEGQDAASDLEWLRLLYGDPMQVLSDMLRSVIVPREGCVFDVADFSSIEARVLFWVAGHEAGLRAFREGQDLYKRQASDVFSIPIEKIGDKSFERFIGKQLILGCGFQMGGKKFVASCAAQGREVSEELGAAAVKAYRKTNAPVVRLWKNLESAAISAVHNPGVVFNAGRCRWCFKGDFLYCLLPSGRRLAYYGPTIKYEVSQYSDEPRAVLHHWGEDSVTKKWVETSTYGGKLTENVVQAIARDLMANAMLNIEGLGGRKLVLSVHDELIAERDYEPDPGQDRAHLEQFIGAMEQLPAWAEGCPVKAEGWSGLRYKK